MGASMITWDDSMLTGLPDIDAQHKEIIAKFNEFSRAIGFSHGEGRETAGNVLDFLQFYAAWHFEREEACMAQYNCPVAEFNKRAHAQFVEKFGRFYRQWQEGNMDSNLMRKTFEELALWIENHIRKTDTQLRPCIEAAGE
jgi:hemerythrin